MSRDRSPEHLTGTGNALLQALPRAQYQRIEKHLELVPVALGEVLFEAGENMSHAFFPIDCIVSIIYVMNNGESAEIAVVGSEGMIGIALFMGGDSTISRAVVQNSGQAFRLKAAVLKSEFDRGGALSRFLLLFVSALLTQMVQTAACNRHHSLDNQLCRWMLLSLDRLSSLRISMSEQLIANMLGVDRKTVAAATGVLAQAGLITYSDGEIVVLDRHAIELRSCECYGVVKRESDRLLSTAAGLSA